MTGIDSWSVTPATNATADGGSINWAEGQPPSSVNNTARQMLTDVRNRNNDLIWFQYGTGDQGAGNLAVPSVYSSGTAFTITGADVTLVYHAGRRVRAVGVATGTIFGTISSTSYNGGNTTTTVNVTWDSGSLSNETLTIYLAQIPVTGKPVPGWNPTAGKTLSVTNNITLAATDGSSPFTLPTRQVLTSGSSATYTTPVGVRQLRIRMAAGGGGGGGSSNANDAGTGGAGGTTTFSATTAIGGSGGQSGGPAKAPFGGLGGTGGSGGTRFSGNGGQSSTNAGTARSGAGGGSAFFGGGGAAGFAGVANTGGGGSGGEASGSGSGGGGGESNDFIINSLAGTYTYTVGAGGTGGTAGSGTVGFAGGSGVIIVDEIY